MTLGVVLYRCSYDVRQSDALPCAIRLIAGDSTVHDDLDIAVQVLILVEERHHDVRVGVQLFGLLFGKYSGRSDSIHTDDLILDHAPSLSQLPSIKVSANMTLLERASMKIPSMLRY